MWLASSNDRLVLPPNMNMAVKSANAAGSIAGSLPVMSFCLAREIKEAVGYQLAHRRHPERLSWRISGPGRNTTGYSGNA